MPQVQYPRARVEHTALDVLNRYGSGVQAKSANTGFGFIVILLYCILIVLVVPIPDFYFIEEEDPENIHLTCHKSPEGTNYSI